MLPAKIQNDFVALKKGYGPVKSYSPQNLELAMKDVLTVSSFDAGQSMADNATVLYAQTQALCKELKGKYGEFTLPEVQEAFRRGIRGEFGPWFGFCGKTYHQFLKGFWDLPGRGQAWLDHLNSEEWKKYESEKPLLFTPEQWDNICKSTFEKYKASKGTDETVFFTTGAAAAIYDVLNEKHGVEIEHPKLGKIKTLVPDKEDRSNLGELAGIEYSAQKKSIKKAGGLKSIEEELRFDESGRTRGNILKKHYLMHYFDKLIEQGK